MVRTVFCNIKIGLDKSSPKLENLFSKTLQPNTGELYEDNKANFISNVQHNEASTKFFTGCPPNNNDASGASKLPKYESIQWNA